MYICLQQKLGKHYEKGNIVPGTSAHQLCPLSSDKIAYKRINNNHEFTGTFTFMMPQFHMYP